MKTLINLAGNIQNKKFMKKRAKEKIDHARLVEGATDVWRCGDSALALLTNKMSPRQRNLLIGLRLKSLSIMLDPGSYHKALAIAEELSPFIETIKCVELTGSKDVADRRYDELLNLELSTKPYRL